MDAVINELLRGIFERARTVTEQDFIKKQTAANFKQMQLKLNRAKAEHGKAVRELSKWEDLMLVYGGRIFEKCGINRDEAGIYEKTRYLSGNCWA